MFNWLLQSSGVIDNPSSGNNAPDAIIGPNIDYTTLFVGFCIGFAAALILWGLVKFTKFLIAYSQAPIANVAEKKSDE